jgi:hypothetical protein
MAAKNHFRILSPDGSLSRDTFVIAPEQPESIMADCLLVIDEMTGRRMTVHETRLFPAECSSSPELATAPQSRCLACGRVVGVVEDEVTCPLEPGELPCVFLHAQAG